ncbi:MAG: RluA family pseudouridine synthase [Actinomycetota bacterium]
MPLLEFVVSPQDGERRLDAVVAEQAGISRTVAARLVASGGATVDGEPLAKSARVWAGANVRVELPEPDAGPQPEEIPIHAVFEDEWLIVLSKPAGLVVHPAPGHPSGTLVNALLARAGARPMGGDANRPGIVHRLDAGTSGLMIVAKDAGAHARLVEQMSARQVTRVYLALVEGLPDTETATIDAPVGRSPRERTKMGVVAGGRPAVTRFRVVERHAGTALLEVRPETGRTHQIRVHLSAAGYPVVGDPTYGGTKALAARLGLDRPFLHAAHLEFDHPVTGARLVLEDELPAELAAALARARE